jgi:hypothetical protein
MQSINCRTRKRFRPPASVAPRKQTQPKLSAALSAREKVPKGFGIKALKMNLLGRDTLVGAMKARSADPAKPLGHLLGEQGTLRGDHPELLEALAALHLAKPACGTESQRMA